MPVEEQLQAFVRVLLAFGLGSAIGLEREYRGFEAGIRTTALVAAGAAMFGVASEHIGDSRIAAAIVQGVGFLGAGLIFQRETTVHNLTTATTVWVSAAIGLLMAMHLWVAAVGTTVTVIVLLELQPVSRWVYLRGDRTADNRE